MIINHDTTEECCVSTNFLLPQEPLEREKRSSKISWYRCLSGAIIRTGPVKNKPGIIVYVFINMHSHGS